MEGWGVDGVQRFRPNMVIFIITLVWKIWYGARDYVPHNNLPTVHWVTQALAWVGDLNACRENPRDQREEQLATVLVGYGLTDQAI